MKRISRVLMIAALATVSYSASAELAPQWSKGTMIANAGLGVSPFGATASVDYVLIDEWWKGHFTVGGELDFGKQVSTYDNDIALGFTPRATYGLNITSEFEVHVTAQIGFGMRTWKYADGSSYKTTSVLWNDFVGCRYFFADDLAAFAEVGYTGWFPIMRAGISFKF